MAIFCEGSVPREGDRVFSTAEPKKKLMLNSSHPFVTQRGQLKEAE